MSTKPQRAEGLAPYTPAWRDRLMARASDAFVMLASGDDFSIEYLMDRAFIACNVRGSHDEPRFARDVGVAITGWVRAGLAERISNTRHVRMWGKV